MFGNLASSLGGIFNSSSSSSKKTSPKPSPTPPKKGKPPVKKPPTISNPDLKNQLGDKFDSYQQQLEAIRRSPGTMAQVRDPVTGISRSSGSIERERRINDLNKRFGIGDNPPQQGMPQNPPGFFTNSGGRQSGQQIRENDRRTQEAMQRLLNNNPLANLTQVSGSTPKPGAMLPPSVPRTLGPESMPRSPFNPGYAAGGMANMQRRSNFPQLRDLLNRQAVPPQMPQQSQQQPPIPQPQMPAQPNMLQLAQQEEEERKKRMAQQGFNTDIM